MEEVSQEKRYSLGTMFSYSTKATMIQWINGAFGVYVFAYYEVYIGLKTELATIAFVLFAVWNAFNDPLIGYTMEKKVFPWTRNKGFKRFPWYLIATIPWLGSYLLIFFVPTNWSAEDSIQQWYIFLWYIISICLYDFLYSLMDVNSLSIYPEKFTDPKSRRIVQSFVAALGILGLVLAFILPPFIVPEEPVAADYRLYALIAAAVGLVLVIPTIPGHFEDKYLREKNLAKLAQNEQQAEPKEKFFKTIGKVIKNRNFMGKISIFFGYQLSALLIQSGAIYILLFVIDETNKKLPIILGSMLGGALVSIPLWLLFAQKSKNHRLVTLIASFILTFSFIPMIFATTVLLWIPCMILFGIGLGAQWFIDPILISELIEDVAVKTGKKEPSVVFGVQAFFVRFNSALQALIFGVVHILTGFKEGAKTLAELKAANPTGWQDAVFGIQIHSIIIPLVIMIISTILFAVLYRLTPQKVQENRKKLQEMQIL
ncbi:MAG: MFS transporter [Candidatus Lokiarchaeota archaeon]|nr:MFS transporter [Candidatus Lokiarchaeota archaeon]